LRESDLRRGHRDTVSFIGGELFPHCGALTPSPKPPWARPTSVPHVVHAEGGRSGTEGLPDKLKETNEEEASKQALAYRLGFCPDGRANRGAATK
jgi:hypothetical protein